MPPMFNGQSNKFSTIIIYDDGFMLAGYVIESLIISLIRGPKMCLGSVMFISEGNL